MVCYSLEFLKYSLRRCTSESTRSATFWGNETEQRTALWRLWKAILQMSAFPLHPVLLCFHTSFCMKTNLHKNIGILHCRSREFSFKHIGSTTAVYVYPKRSCCYLCTDPGHQDVEFCENKLYRYPCKYCVLSVGKESHYNYIPKYWNF